MLVSPRFLAISFLLSITLFSALSITGAFAYTRSIIGVEGGGPSGVAIDAETGMIYVTNLESDSVSLIDARAAEEISTIDVEGEPFGIALDANASRLYVANSRDDSISVIDTKENVVVETMQGAGEGPYSLALASDGLLLVANEVSESVSVIDIEAGYQVVETIGLPDSGTSGIAINSNNIAYVAGRNLDEVYAIDLSDYSVAANITVGAYPLGVAIDPLTNRVYVANQDSDSVSVIDGSDNVVIANVTVGSFPAEIAVDSENNMIYVTNEDEGTVSVIDGSTNAVVNTIRVGEGPRGIALDPNTNTLYVASALSNAVYVISDLDELEPGAKSFSISTTHEGKSFTITGESEGVQASSFTIDPFKSISIRVTGEGSVELALPTGLIDGILNVTAIASDGASQEVGFAQVRSTRDASVIALSVPEGTSSLVITGARVVPEFSAILALMALALPIGFIAARRLFVPAAS